ncbi:MAG: hypothetical protein AAB947_00235 [Patescibacteria group bacterium]
MRTQTAIGIIALLTIFYFSFSSRSLINTANQMIVHDLPFTQTSIPTSTPTISNKPLASVPISAFLYSRHDAGSEGPSGHIVALTTATTSLYHISSAYDFSSASYSRMSGKIVYVSDHGTDFLILLNKGIQHVLLQAPTNFGYKGAVLSANGDRIAYVRTILDTSTHTQQIELWQIHSDGSENKLVSRDILSHMPKINNDIYLLGWSQDVQRVFFIPICHCDAPISKTTYSIHTITGEIKEEKQSLLGAISPDGSRALLTKHSYIDYVNERSVDMGEDGIFLMDLKNGTETKIITDSKRSFGSAVWSPDGTQILYSAARKEEIQSSGFDGSPYHSLTHYALYTIGLDMGKEKKILDIPDGSSLKDFLPAQLAWINPSTIAYVVFNEMEPGAEALFTLDITANGTPRLIDSSDGFYILGEYYP